jgi:hypothetical protein
MRINDNGVDREMTADELATYQANAALIEADQQTAAQAEADALEARKAPLRRLGLTEDEINTVLGL